MGRDDVTCLVAVVAEEETAEVGLVRFSTSIYQFSYIELIRGPHFSGSPLKLRTSKLFLCLVVHSFLYFYIITFRIDRLFALPSVEKSSGDFGCCPKANRASLSLVVRRSAEHDRYDPGSESIRPRLLRY